MTEEEAIAVARSVADANGWPWLEPTRVRKYRSWWIGPALWEVQSNAESLGMNARVVLEDATGQVREKGYLPR